MRLTKDKLRMSLMRENETNKNANKQQKQQKREAKKCLCPEQTAGLPSFLNAKTFLISSVKIMKKLC